jgi:hypothetical protein
MKIIKFFYRLFRYPAEWSKQIREIQIRKNQAREIKNFNRDANKLIVFFVPGADYITGKETISGGLISIVSLAEESRKIFSDDTSTEVICCTYFGDHLLFELTTFENTTPVLEYRQLPRYFRNTSSIILHVPELFVEDFYFNQLANLKFDIENLQLNILNQNIDLMPQDNIVSMTRGKFKQVTITTAHKKYCTSGFREQYNVPLHLLSVWISPEKYIRTPFTEKKDLILFSPDDFDLTREIIELIKTKLPQFETRIINGLSYNQYKELIGEAKFVITTGEGLDAYFIETYFSGGVAYALKNRNFFDEKYLDLPCLFENKANSGNELLYSIEKYNNPVNYSFLTESVANLLCGDYSSTLYQDNIRKFYKKEFTYA